MGTGKRMHRELQGEDYKPEMLTSWAVTKENRNVIQGGINWLQVLKNYFQ